MKHIWSLTYNFIPFSFKILFETLCNMHNFCTSKDVSCVNNDVLVNFALMQTYKLLIA